MKKIILILLIIPCFSKADENKKLFLDASCVTNHSDSESIYQNCADSVIQNVEQVKVIEKTVFTKKQHLKVKKSKPVENKQLNKQQAKFWGELWDAVVSVVVWVASPVRPVWGSYDISPVDANAPLTLFHTNSFTQDKTLLIDNIKNHRYGVREIYVKIYDDVISSGHIKLPSNPPPTQTGDGIGQDPNAAWAKNAAFVFLLSVDKDGNALDNGLKSDLKHYALQALTDCNIHRPSYNFYECDEQQWVAPDLINYVCAYDMLRAGGCETENLSEPASELRHYTKILKDRSEGIFESLSSLRNNNQTIRVASALAMAAIVLHDMQSYSWDWDGQPDKWARKGNCRLMQTMFTGLLKSQSTQNTDAGYFEGPGYFSYAADCLIPFMVAFDNAVGNQQILRDVSEDPLSYGTEEIHNYLLDENWRRIFRWYVKILQPNGFPPSYDDTKISSGIPHISALGGKEFSPFNTNKLVALLSADNYDARADYLAANNPFVDVNTPPYYSNKPSYLPPQLVESPVSGDFVINTPPGVPADQARQIHMLAEPVAPQDSYSELISQAYGWTHEHPDLSSFIINAGQEILAIDPPYTGYNNREQINKAEMHNLITVNGYGPIYHTNFQKAEFTNKTSENEEFTFTSDNYLGCTYSRKIKVIAQRPSNGVSGHYYYQITDHITSNDNANKVFTFNLNGNGSNTNGENSFSLISGHTYVWSHPCESGNRPTPYNGWKLEGTVDVNSPGSSNPTYAPASDFVHGTSPFEGSAYSYITKQIDGGDFPTGKHTRLQVSQTGNDVIFSTILFPKRCSPVSGTYGKTGSGEVYGSSGEDYAASLVTNLGDDSLSNFHLCRLSNIDTLTYNNPFRLDTPPVHKFITTANNSLLSISPHREFKDHYCTSFTNFRVASLDDGSYLKYDDTVYIQSNAVITCKYKITGKYKYRGFINAPTGGAIVTFRIPDLDNGVPMVALSNYNGSLTSTYNDSTNWQYITVTFSAGKTDFDIEPANPCDYDCYFPPISINIKDSTFEADDGDRHTLGHKLKILQNKGLLHVTNKTRIDMCSGIYLRNIDSLIIDGPCQEKYKGFDPCSGIQSLYLNDQSSAIIVSAGSALVLDSGSYTYLKAGGAIWIRQNGSLVIKKNAFVQIGDSPNFCGYGEIITEAGAYVYIDSLAHIEFAKTPGDTVDRNLFVVRQTYSGVYSPMALILEADTILPNNGFSIPLCALDTVNPIKNREWGYCNFMHPYATYQARRDTLCPGEPVYVDLKRILNSSYTEITVCRVDSVYRFDVNNNVWYWKDTCVVDTFWKDSVLPGDSPCVMLHMIPDYVVYHFRPNTLHRITINTQNDCGVHDDSIGYVFIADSPRFNITVPDTVCPGSTLTIQVADSSLQPVYYTFGIAELPDSMHLLRLLANPQDTGDLASYSESNLGYLPDSFSFSNFHLKGNRRYGVYLFVTNSCGSYGVHGYTNTNFSADIKIHLASTYKNPVGPAAFQLEGIASGATSFTWDPSTYLDNPSSLTPICTPTGPTQYVFTATDGTCTDSDTMNVRHNEWAYAGNDTEVCYNQNIILGTDYMAAAWLGLIWHSANHNDYDNVYQNVQLNDSLFAKLFMQYFIQHIADFYGQTAVDNFINNKDLRSAIYRDANFITYYNNFISNNGNSNSFSDFDNMISNNSTLQTLVENTYQYAPNSNFLDYAFAQYSIFAQYTSWRNANNPLFTTEWERLDDTTWTTLKSDSGYFNIVPSFTTDKYYRITVIDDRTNTVEYDQVLIKRDSIVTPAFNITFQIDSTVFFGDASHPNQHDYLYSWDFGDGGSSTIKNPYHTFSGSDTFFIVCLNVRDSCGTYTKCDTLKIDTFYNTGLFGKTGLTDNKQSNDKATSNLKQQTPNNNYLSVARPNPFSEFTIAEYSLAEGTHNAEIRITTMLGLAVKTYKLKDNKGMIAIDGTQIRDGMYYYYLVVDGVVVGKQIMLVQK